jgi:hypothetical protein
LIEQRFDEMIGVDLAVEFALAWQQVRIARQTLLASSEPFVVFGWRFPIHQFLVQFKMDEEFHP